MVVALGPGKFYGSSLPRPRVYTDVKLNEERVRVNPPMGVMDPLLSWADDAHWSMGGLSFKHLRLQGRIEGNIKKLRSEQKKKIKNNAAAAAAAINNNNTPTTANKSTTTGGREQTSPSSSSSVPVSPPPPPPPAATKRRRFALLLNDESSSSENEDDEEILGLQVPEEKQQQPSVVVISSGVGSSRGRLRLGGKQLRARKLVDDFDRVTSSDPVVTEGSDDVLLENRENPSEKQKIDIRKRNYNGSRKSVVIEKMVEPSSSTACVGNQVAGTVASRTRRRTNDDASSLVRSNPSKSKDKMLIGERKIRSGTTTARNNAPPPPLKTRTSPRLSSGGSAY